VLDKATSKMQKCKMGSTLVKILDMELDEAHDREAQLIAGFIDGHVLYVQCPGRSTNGVLTNTKPDTPTQAQP